MALVWTDWQPGYDYLWSNLVTFETRHAQYELAYRDDAGEANDDEGLDAQVWDKARGGVNIPAVAPMEDAGGAPVVDYGAFISQYDWGWDPTVPGCWHPVAGQMDGAVGSRPYEDDGWVGYHEVHEAQLVTGFGVDYHDVWDHGQGHAILRVFAMAPPLPPEPPPLNAVAFQWEDTVVNTDVGSGLFPRVIVDSVDVYPVVSPGSWTGSPTFVITSNDTSLATGTPSFVQSPSGLWAYFFIDCDSRAYAPMPNPAGQGFDYVWWYHDAPGAEVARVDAGGRTIGHLAGPINWLGSGARLWFFGYEEQQFGDYPGHGNDRYGPLAALFVVRLTTPRYRWQVNVPDGPGVPPSSGGTFVPLRHRQRADGLTP